MKPKIILLDWDGTLANATPIAIAAMNATRVRRGEHPLEGREALNESAKDLTLMFPNSEDQRYFIESHERISAATPPQPMPGADKFVHYLQTLRTRGILVGIISNKPSEKIRREMHPFGWDGMFDLVLGRDAVAPGRTKPERDLMDKATASYPQPINHREIIYVGDSDQDARFARNCGVRFMGVGNSFNEPLDPAQHCADINAVHRRLRMVLTERMGEIGI